MGTGKTTLGRALEARLPGWRYIDLDEEVERRAAMSIPAIFGLHGEEAFRKMERKGLEAVAAQENVIVGCGGGTPCFFDNMELMNRSGTTILLRASHEVLLRRLLEAQTSRPKLMGLSPEEVSRYILREQEARECHYCAAQHSFPSDLLESAAQIEATCRLFLSRFAHILERNNKTNPKI